MNIDLYTARLAERLAYIKANADYFQDFRRRMFMRIPPC